MRLPFTQEEFLDVFAAYNQLLWPAAALLWLITLAVTIGLWRAGPRASRLVAALLAAHWAWSAIAYHLAFFRRVNPAAALFAALFLVQAGLFWWRGVARPRLVFEPSRSVRGKVAAALVACALAYPGLGLLLGLSYPRAPTFGLPCPTTILTTGLLLTLPWSHARSAAVIAMIWAAIGGSAAFVLGMHAALALPVAGALLAWHVMRPSRQVAPVRLQPRRGTR